MSKNLRAILILTATLLVATALYFQLGQGTDQPAPIAKTQDNSISIYSPYIRTNGPKAKAAAGFLIVRNTGSRPDRLVGAATDIAMMVETHTHQETGDGIMQMIHAENGFEIPAGQELVLKRGGKHLMLMQIKAHMTSGDVHEIILQFEKAGAVTVPFSVE